MERISARKRYQHSSVSKVLRLLSHYLNMADLLIIPMIFIFLSCRWKSSRWERIWSWKFKTLSWIRNPDLLSWPVKFVSNAYPHYLNGVYEYAAQCRIESKSNFAKLKVSFWNTNMGQNGLSYIGLSLWNNLPGSLKKKNTILNTFKHNLKKKYIDNLAGS